MPNYEDEFPPSEGPFKVGATVIQESFDRDEPVFVVELDYGAFRRVWEIVEENARNHYPTRETLSTARAEIRAVRAFRAPWRTWSGYVAPVVEAGSREVDPVDAANSENVDRLIATRRLVRRSEAATSAPPQRERRKIVRAPK